MTSPLLIINQRQEDGQVSMETSISNPLVILDLLNMLQKQIIIDCSKKLELKKEAAIITHERAALT